MTDLAGIINSVYGAPNLTERILNTLAEAGHAPMDLTPEILSPMDELHSMGREATVRLGKRAGFDEKTEVIDIGCGIGGAARTLAHTFGCRVTGIDLTEDFCRAATDLSQAVGMGEKVLFRQANALELPFEPASFDGATMIHMNMNIQDKPRLFAEAARVLKPSGTLALWEVCKGENPEEPTYPLPWSDDPSSSFLVSLAGMNQMLEQADFIIEESESALQELMAWSKNQPPTDAPGLEITIKNFLEKQQKSWRRKGSHTHK